MKAFRILAAAAASALLCAGGAAANIHDGAPFPVKAAMAPVEGVIAAMATGDSKRLAGVYANDAVIVDNQAPFQWTGADAGADWFARTAGRWGKLWYGKFVPTVHSPLMPASEMQFAPGSAYVIVPGRLTSRNSSKRIAQSGALTFTLREVSGAWKITSQVWTVSASGTNP